MKNLKKRIIAYMCVFLVVAVMIEMNILGYTNKKQVYRTSQILLNQVDSILSSNEKNEQRILDELKEDYVERANTVAYILDGKDGATCDSEELKRIADMMGIDEINLFDEQGVIVNGTYSSYFGYSFDSGEQISYFKPMLGNKELTMCQDVTPNTAEAKSMMYAIVWNQTGTYMVQVGIEPVRLIAELRKNSINEVVSKMPIYDGMNIYVADIADGVIVGSTYRESIGDTVYNYGILDAKDDLRSIKNKSVHLNGYRCYCNYRQHGDYIIAVVHSTKTNVESFFVSILIEVVWLLIAGSVILYALIRLTNANHKINEQMSMLKSISDIYYSMHLIDMSDYSIQKIEGNELMERVVREGVNAADMLNRIIKLGIANEYVEAALEFVDLSTLKDRLRDKSAVFMDAVDLNVGWLRMSFIKVDEDKDGFPLNVIIATQVIEEDKKREEELSIKANRDELTGLNNRRAYEDDLALYKENSVRDDFIYAAIDINGLKVVNDELGHASGDEMIKGAAECLRRTLGHYGKVYRTGGDEFVAMFNADEKYLQVIAAKLDKETDDWVGEGSLTLSLSVGYVTKKEFGSDNVEEMAKLADVRMYEVKNNYYAKKGIDRKGQAAAHKALCGLYTKILKINLTDDTYSIINMDESERTEEKGFATTISEWLHDFGSSGQVHEEDLDEYLKLTNRDYLMDYFKQDKTSISIFYRRRYGDEYKQVMMEMIPADDYKEDNQSLYLYVKSIDK